MAEQTKEERIKKLRAFDLSKRDECPDNVIHAQKGVIKFRWQNKSIDLRTASQVVIEAVADDQYCKVLTRKGAAKASTPSPAPQAKPAEKDDSKSTKK